MAMSKFTSPFPRLKLSIDEKKEFCRTAKKLVCDMQEDYERYLWIDHGKLNHTRWSMVREREDVRVYHDRRPGAGTGDKDLHELLTIGTVTGSLNDAMYGVLNNTTDAMRLKTAYIRDTLDNCAVLATIQEPKVDKPFRSVVIKWLVKRVPLAARALVKHRDVVYLEATGIKKLSNGDQVGFQLLHAVRFPQTPALPSYTRVGMSICTMWKQQSSDRVQAYMKSYVEVPDRILAPLVIRSTADALVSLWRTMHCAQMKKLAWLMRRKMPMLEDTKSSGGRSLSSDGNCGVCGNPPPSRQQAANKSMCVVCSRIMCKSCCVKRELYTISPRSQLVERVVAFCVPCLTVAVRADAADVARDEIPGGRVTHGTLSELIKVVGTRGCNPHSDDEVRRHSLNSSMGAGGTERKPSSASVNNSFTQRN